MLITITRYECNKHETLSVIKVDGQRVCFGLEDEYRETKVPGETRIPAGKYPVKLRTEGSIHPKYDRAFPDFHEGMLWLQDVPGFSFIYIHMGNTEKHTDGCILVAEQARINAQGRMTAPNSRPAYIRLYNMVVEAARNGELFVEIIDRDI